MLVRICHTTRFDYEKPAYQSHNEVRMHPSDDSLQRCLSFELEIQPAASTLEYTDFYGNHALTFSINAPHQILVVVARSTVERLPNPAPPARRVTFTEFLLKDAERSQAEHDFLGASRLIPFSQQMRRFFWLARPGADEDVSAYAMRAVAFIYGQFAYEPGKTRVHSTTDEILSTGAGVCQDFAHLAIGVLRLAGIPARYVSGYLAPRLNSQTLGEQASHAWIEARLPGAGWIGIDPTHGCRADERHIKVAIGRDYSDVSPIRGVYRSAGGGHVMKVELSVEPEPQASDPAHGSQQ